jgi:hypothetical protein
MLRPMLKCVDGTVNPVLSAPAFLLRRLLLLLTNC